MKENKIIKIAIIFLCLWGISFPAVSQIRYSAKFGLADASQKWFKLATFNSINCNWNSVNVNALINYASPGNKYNAQAFLWLRKHLDENSDIADWQYSSTYQGDILKLKRISWGVWELWAFSDQSHAHISIDMFVTRECGLEVTVYNQAIHVPDPGAFTDVPLKGDWYWNNGKVLIGTKDAPSGEHLLYVNGSVLATEVNVKLKNQWPDYVFEEGYMPMPLEELEIYIKEHKHLPDTPKEKEVMENGVNLLEMNQKLLQKIEELTLYIIQQEKEIKKYEKFDEKLKDLEHSLNLVKQEQEGLRK